MTNSMGEFTLLNGGDFEGKVMEVPENMPVLRFKIAKE